MTLFGGLVRVISAAVVCLWLGGHVAAMDFTVAGTILTPAGVVTDGAIAVTGQTIGAIGPATSVYTAASAIKPSDAVILPGFVDMHNHLTWNVLPRWVPGRKFASRYEWQDSPEYDRLLVAPHNAVMDRQGAPCEAEIYAEIKALVGGATSTIGSIYDKDHPEYADCAKGLVRNLDLASGLGFKRDDTDPCKSPQPIAEVVYNEVFPLEESHGRFDYFLCELNQGALRSLVIHLSEGAPTDSSAHREFTMLDKAGLLKPGMVIVHGTALRDADFLSMQKAGVGLVWSPRSNDELYGATTNVGAASLAHVPIAIAPDWSPSGSAGMLQEIGYVARRYRAIASEDLIRMATSVPAQMARLEGSIGDLSKDKKADFVVIKAKRDPKARNPDLDPVVKATPADILLVVVGGEPLYGDPDLMKQLRPETALDDMTVCGIPKTLYLGESNAPRLKESFGQIQDALNAALKKAGSKLPEIECE
jgi:5-methylthioadenosine/S-adenosylhomocysteine deaminase